MIKMFLLTALPFLVIAFCMVEVAEKIEEECNENPISDAEIGDASFNELNNKKL